MSDSDVTNTTVSESKPRQSSVWWGISALLTAWTGLIGLILGIMATVKGFSKKAPNTLNGIFGIFGILIALGAMTFQLIFGMALIFGTGKEDLGDLVPRNSVMGNGIRYSIDLPEKFKQETTTEDGERYIYRDSSEDKVLAATYVSCGVNDIAPTDTTATLSALKEVLLDDTVKSDLSSELADMFGGVKNLTIGSSEDFSNGYYAGKAFATSLYAEHPSDNSQLYGEMHIMVTEGNLCSAAWLGTTGIHEKNESLMNDALITFRVN